MGLSLKTLGVLQAITTVHVGLSSAFASDGHRMSWRGTELRRQVAPHFISENDGILCLKTTDHVTPIS